MPRIRNNNASAAAVSDTASVATQQRGPLHTASQGPLSPQAAMGVFDTSIAASRQVAVSDTVNVAAMGVVDTSAAARRPVAVSDTATVTVSDTVTVIPCLKSVLKYPASATPREMLVIDDDDISDALDRMEKTQRAFYKKFLRFWYLNPRHREKWLAVAKAYAKGEEIKTMWKKLLRRANFYLVRSYYNAGDIDNSPRQRSVSFGAVTATKYVLTKQERFDKLGEKKQRGEERDRFPHRDFDKIRPRKGYFMDVGRVTARVWDSSLADANHKDWIDNGNEEALALDKQPLPRTDIAFVFSAFEAAVVDTAAVHSTQSANNDNDVVDTSISASAAAAAAVVSDTTPSTTAVQQQSTETNAIVDMAVSSAAPAVVSDTTATPTTTEPNAIVDMAVPVTTTQQPQQQQQRRQEPPPLRRSARIAARTTTPAVVPVRRTARKGAVKPQGFYKV